MGNSAGMFCCDYNYFRQLFYLFYAQSLPLLKIKKEVRGYDFVVFSVCYKTLLIALLLLFGAEEWMLRDFGVDK